MNLQLGFLWVVPFDRTVKGVGNGNAQRDKVAHSQHKTNQRTEQHGIGKPARQRIDSQHGCDAEGYRHRQAADLPENILMLSQRWCSFLMLVKVYRRRALLLRGFPLLIHGFQ